MLRRTIALLLLPPALVAQAPRPAMTVEEYEPRSTLRVPEHPKPRARFPFIDVHGHQRLMSDGQVDQLVREMDAMNMGLMVNLSGSYGDALAERVKNLKGRFPSRFVVFANMNLREVNRPDFGPWAAAQLEHDVKVGGAQGLKVFKELGMDVKDATGKRIPLDDPRFDPVWDKCGELGIPVIRVMVGIGDQGYLATIDQVQREYDALAPLLDKYGVTIGVQNHCDRCVANALGLRHLMGKYDPRHIAAIWDAAHEALNGNEPELAIDIVWSHLRMVNLKNAYWLRANGPDADCAKWTTCWTTGRRGLASWPRVAAELKRRRWRGVVCLTAEYDDHESVNRLIAEDLAFAKSLFD